MSRTSRIMQLAGALLAASVTACGAQSNPMIGKWHLSGGAMIDGAIHCETTDMEFTETTQTLHNAAVGDAFPASTRTTKVTYNISPGKAYVMGNIANYAAYKVVSSNEIVTDDTYACVYKRVN